MPGVPQKGSLLNLFQRIYLESSSQVREGHCLLQGSRDITVSNKLPVNSCFQLYLQPIFSGNRCHQLLIYCGLPMTVVLLLCPLNLGPSLFPWICHHGRWVSCFSTSKILSLLFHSLSYVFMYFNPSFSSSWYLGRKQWYTCVFNPPSLTGSLQNFYFRGGVKDTQKRHIFKYSDSLKLESWHHLKFGFQRN